MTSKTKQRKRQARRERNRAGRNERVPGDTGSQFAGYHAPELEERTPPAPLSDDLSYETPEDEF